MRLEAIMRPVFRYRVTTRILVREFLRRLVFASSTRVRGDQAGVNQHAAPGDQALLVKLSIHLRQQPIA